MPNLAVSRVIASLMAVSVWPSGRPTSGHRCRVDASWRPYAGAGPTSQARACLKYATTPPAHPTSISLSLFFTVQAEAG